MKRRITSLFLMLCMAFSFLPAFSLTAHAATITPSQPSSGTGTEDDPYQIGTARELAWFRDQVNAGNGTICAVLTADIDLAVESNWTPIGNSNSYYGTFNGQNHSIKNLTCSGSGRLGLFGYAGYRGSPIIGAVIENLSVVGGNLSNASTNGGMVATGGIVASVTGSTISNCSFTGDIVGSSKRIQCGGIIGCVAASSDSISTISNCSFTGTLNCSSASYIGGLIGLVGDDTTITDCYTATSPGGTYKGDCLGGLIGSIQAGSDTCTIERCYSTATISSSVKTTGGLIGQCWYSTLNINDCYYAGNYQYFLGAVYGGTLTASRCHIYSASGSESLERSLDNSPTITHNYVRMLKTDAPGTGADTATEDLIMPASMFTDKTNFPTWDFKNVWRLEEGDLYPTLRSSSELEIASEDDRTITIYKGGAASLNLTDYFDIGGDKEDGRFTFEITEGATVTQKQLNYETMEEEDADVTFAENSDGTLTLNTDLELGSYPLTISGHDTDEKYEDFTFDLNLTLMESVPAPAVLTGEFPYSKSITLDMVPITWGWWWTNGTVIPKNDYAEGYEAYYQFEEGKKDYYDYSAVTGAVYDEDNNRITVKLQVPVTRSDESPWPVYFTVKDADTDAAIEKATIESKYEDDFPSGHETGSDGTLTAEMSKGDNEITVSADGYQTKKVTVNIDASLTTNNITISLVPERCEFTLPVVKDKESLSEVQNGRVTITKIDGGKANAWNLDEEGRSSKSLTANAKATIELPDGRFKLQNATYGYSTKDEDAIYVGVTNHVATYYSDSQCSAELSDELKGIIYATKLSDPLYNLKISKSGDEQTFTAKLFLKNIKATYGSFGLRYDPDMFKLEPESDISFTNVTCEGSIEDMYGEEWSNSNGYYDFVWTAGDEDGSEFDTQLADGDGVQIAEFEFSLQDGASADDITVDSFGIEPWTDTKAAKEFKKLADEAGEDAGFEEYWRKIDGDNNKYSLKEGRIDEQNSVVNGIETGGFFQAAVNGDLGSENPLTYYDIMTVLTYEFDIKNSVIKFHVIDDDDEDDLQGASISLFDLGTRLFDTKKTNWNGRATFSVDTSELEDITFSYEAHLKGYWPRPESGLASDRETVAAQTGKATEVEVRLKKKIYHVPVIKAAPEQTVELISNADLGGEKYGYNGREFHFRIKGKNGYKIKDGHYPAYALITIGDSVQELKLEPDDHGLFELKAQYLNQEPLSKAEMEELGYTDAKEQPDSEGYRSYNIEITFAEFDVEELDYTVRAQTNALGKVSYNPDLPVDGGLTATTANNHDIIVKTIKQDTETQTESNRQTGTFTFTADTDCMVEKVYINGLQIHTYDDLPGFTYTFGLVDEDNSIIVMFWDGINHSTDSVVTLVVGEFGSVDISSPVEENDVRNTRRVYLNPTDNLEFTAEAMNDYKLYRVQKQTDNLPLENITESADENGKYSVEPVESKSVTVYVTFCHKDASVTPNLFVKSYVYSGDGVVNPAGILICTMYDSPEFKLTANTAKSWKVKGVMLSPYEDIDNVEEWDFDELADENTYTYHSLRNSMAIGAIFVEKSYTVQGLVDLSQDSTATTKAPLSGATLTFVRLNDDGTEKDRDKHLPVKAVTTAARKNASFSVELPAGKWNVYVTKPGYLTYKLTGYEFEAPENETTVIKFGLNEAGTEQFPVVPYIGSTKGNRISLTDAATIKSGWRDGVNETVRAMADVDNDNEISGTDMAYVWFNYNKLLVTQEYDKFKKEGSATIPYKKQ